MRNRLRLNGAANVLRDKGRTELVRLRQNDGKFLAAVSRKQISGALNDLGHRSRHPPETLVAGLMSMAIVVALEMIDIGDDDSDRLSRAFGAAAFAIESDIEAADRKSVV